MLLAGCLLFGGSAMAAEATPDQVYQAAQAGNYREAQAMMDQILRDHPNSAKAHFVEAELLGKQGKLQQAQAELNTALRLDPSQNFARPGAVDELRTLIASGSGAASRAQGTFGGIPWGMVLGIAALLIVVSLMMRARRRANVPSGGPGPYGYGYGATRNAPPYGPQGPQGPQGGYGYPGGAGPAAPATGGMGSGIMGGLATGAAVGAGVVAGEALMNRVLNGGGSAHAAGNAGNPNAVNDTGAGNSAEPGYDMGGNDFGLRDAGSWDDDPARKLGSSNDGGGADTWNIGNPWNDDDASSDGGGSWDDNSGGSDDDWT
ncbi:tetratricopeptide repeat protein [Bordetella bronchialis]|uniref:Uncharacterized protein n=1 Tax=Bordetella bronchialis TaxID=463025 RepID=A0A193FWX3_9BORD|nr:tetratricopeptide repeat protein [Bordetella bronchialis]ANN71681.1 hypothetical protein BAU08_10350 [Bordetella bronchialis]